MTLIPEYIIVMTWALAAVIIVAIIAAIFFRLYIMLLSNEKESLRNTMYDFKHQIDVYESTKYKLKLEVEELEAKKKALK